MKVRYRPTALAQIDAIFRHIEAHDAAAARRVVQSIRASIIRVGRFPYSARASIVPAIRELPIRRYPYIVFYTVDEAAQEVIILRVWHTAKDPKRHLD